MIKWLLFFTLTYSGIYAQQVEDQILYNIIIDKPDGDSINIHYKIVVEDTDQEKGFTVNTDSGTEFVHYLLEDISSLPNNRNNILIFLHGMFGSNRWTYKHVIGMLSKAYVYPENSDISRILSINWPANNVEYKDNKARIPRIAEELKTVIVDIVRQVQLVDIFNPTFSSEIDIIAHSLGNELFKEIIGLIDDDQMDYPLFDQVVLAAPDLDIDVLDNTGPMAALEYLAQGTHVYYSRKDLTLGVSKNLNKKDRMGIKGPADSTTIWDSLFFIDVSEIKDEPNFGERLSGHSYYRSSSRATGDILCVLVGQYDSCNSNRSPIDQKRNIYKLNPK